MNTEEIHHLARVLGERLVGKGWMFSCAESCTGGLLAAAMTDTPGSSRWFDRGVVTYSNEAKQSLLGVHADTLERFGAVSERSEEHTSELQSRENLVCRLLLEKKKRPQRRS